MADTLSARTEVPLPAGISNNYSAGGMTYLGLVSRLRRECGVTGSNPATVTTLSGEMLRLANYINQAWMDIQNMHSDWEFLRQDLTFVAQVGKQKYSTIEMQIASFGAYKLDSFTISSFGDATDERPLAYMHYDDFRYMYMYGSRRTSQNRPVCFSLNGQKDFLLGGTPDAQYQIYGEGYAMPTEMVNDSDRPAMPGKFHMAIVYGAMMLYGNYEAAPEVYGMGEMQYNKLIARLANDQLPEMRFGAPLE